ncbi:MAG: hypothetical protein EA353_12830 [Puniceicoccaceae bacterium]|nr:MAG: hypothetical protein EA353_12830 [Puniceicoccaceae bacterium]
MILKFKLLAVAFAIIPFLGMPRIALGQTEGPSTISVQISALSLDQEIQNLKFLTNGEVNELNVFTTSRSNVHRYQGPPRMTFFREKPGVDGEVIRTPVGSVELNQSAGRYLLFFVRQPGTAEQYGILALPDSLSDFQPGSFRFVNLAPFNIAVQLGEERFMIEQRDFKDVRGNFEHGTRYRTVMVSLPNGEDPVPSYSGRVFFNERMRMMYIIFPSEGGQPGQIRFVGIPDAVVREAGR